MDLRKEASEACKNCEGRPCDGKNNHYSAWRTGRRNRRRNALFSQRYAMPNDKVKAVLTDIGTEELGHMEMISAIVHQLTRNLSMDEIRNSGFAPYFADHTTGIYPVDASGVPFNAATFQSTGDPITDLNEDLAAEQKARTTYDNILLLCDDPDVRDAIKFLREREIVHYQRFGESIEHVLDKLNCKNYYAFNPAFTPK